MSRVINPNAKLRLRFADDYSDTWHCQKDVRKRRCNRRCMGVGFSACGDILSHRVDLGYGLIALFFALIFWATLAMREKAGLLPWAAYGALWVVGVLINPSILSLFPFLLGWLVWDARKAGIPWAKPAAAALLVFTIGLVPWTIRNYRVLTSSSSLRSNFGLELWLGNNPTVIKTISHLAHPNDNPVEGEKYKRMGEIAYMADKQDEALMFMSTHPQQTLEFMFYRFEEIWLARQIVPSTCGRAAP